MSLEDEELLRSQLAALRQEHRDLDDAIDALLQSSTVNTLQVQRLKKKKLSLKDEIARLEGSSLPDIIA